ncbi:methionine/alanine import family NSS transporter small subunit [Hoyosella sp. G463]|uniref:Methionine/alanine import family NSS transporter small subunit n=1 Tax=Lolliginicoccus lacisalsi TaxID=2742202 RepID=A0A927PMD4_9ACTN|nr:methionine/alanine import family NSS transporter small subunit [Lolliginicoccus lacisalsi]MBD8506256.1 methionine/alanine import family NSS transporter small subunit [Lolliginicoccus lacisalsi]
MTTTAIIMMILSLTIVWGGLIASLIHLRNNPDKED